MRQKVYSKDIILVLAATFFYMASPMLVTPLITGFTESIGASAALMGLVGGLMNLVSLLCRPIAGNLADRISKYKLSFIGAVFMTAACVGYIFAPNEIVVIIARIINGFGFACCSVCMATWMSNMLPKEKIGSGMGVYGTMNALAMAAAPAIGVSAYQTFGYRVSFVIALIFSLAIIVVIRFTGDKGEPENTGEERNDTERADAERAESENTGRGSADEKQKRRLELIDVKVIPIALIIMLFAIPYCATQSFLVTYAEVRGLNVSVSLFFPAYAVVLIVLRLSLRNLFDKLPFHVFLLVSALSELLAILFLTVMKNNAVMLLASCFLAGGYGVMCSVCQSAAVRAVGPEHAGLANSTYYMGFDAGMIAGPVVGGALFGGVDLAWFFPALMLTVPLAIAACLVAQRRA